MLLAELNEIALDCDSDIMFERACKIKFGDFLKTSADYHHEVSKLKIMLLIDANLFFFLKGPEFEVMEKILKAPSFELLLTIGSLGIYYAKQQISSVIDIIKKAEDRRNSTGYAIYSNYRYLLAQ
jgi:hypothetical protein